MQAFEQLSVEEEATEDARGIEPPHRPAYAILGIAPVTLSPDLEVRLFRASVREALEVELRALGKTAYPVAPRISGYVTQDRRVSLSVAHAPHERDWGLTVAWDGSVAIGIRMTTGMTPQTLISDVARPSYEAAFRLLRILNAIGPAYSRLWVVDLEDRAWCHGVVIRRGPHDLDVAAIDFDRVVRELSRAIGFDAAEPEV